LTIHNLFVGLRPEAPKDRPLERRIIAHGRAVHFGGVGPSVEDEFMTDDVALSLRVITGVACDRFARFSLDYAAAQGEILLHIAHKRTALPQTEALFIGAFEKLKSEYPTIALNPRREPAGLP
jgi:isocitrate/isopropylmalate dehydrogenase